MRDYCAVVVPLGRASVAGQKPPAFCFWIFELLNLRPEDEFHDLFPGSGAVGRAWEKWRSGLFSQAESLSQAEILS